MVTVPELLHTQHRKSTVDWVKNLKLLLQRLINERDVFDLGPGMTLVLLMLYGGEYWYLKRPVTILCAAAILYRPLRCSELFWFATTIVLVASNYYNWFLIDNHKYLITYWCLTLYVSRLTTDPGRTIALSGRYLIGFAFLFATVWKLISNDYLDGTFFHYSLLMDDRFASLAALLGGISQAAHVQNHQAIKDLLTYSSVLESIQFQSTLLVVMLAKFLTWWTIIIEGFVALAFLWPQGRFISKWRDYSLLLFTLTTYSIASVIGFGWVLITMGAAQSTLTSKYNRFLYIAAFFILQVYLTPWQAIISQYLKP